VRPIASAPRTSGYSGPVGCSSQPLESALSSRTRTARTSAVRRACWRGCSWRLLAQRASWRCAANLSAWISSPVRRRGSSFTAGLAQAELDLAQLAAADLRRLNPAGDLLPAQALVVEDDLDRVHALGGSAGGGAAAAGELGQLAVQRGMQALQEPCDDVAALVSSQAEAPVAADRELHPGAHDRSVAVRAPPAVTLLEDHAASLHRGSPVSDARVSVVFQPEWIMPAGAGFGP